MAVERVGMSASGMDTLATDYLDKLLTNYQTCLFIDVVCSFSVSPGHGRELRGRMTGGSTI